VGALVALLCLPRLAFAQANGKLQINYMDVGQGDGAVLISPLGEVALFDIGLLNQCAKPVGYLQRRYGQALPKERREKKDYT
jgi:hypothetical protein